MRRIALTALTAAALTLSVGAMAQPMPVPGGSGSQVTSPKTYGNTAKRDRERSMLLQQRQMGLTTGSVTHHPVKKKHVKHTTKKNSTMPSSM